MVGCSDFLANNNAVARVTNLGIWAKSVLFLREPHFSQFVRRNGVVNHFITLHTTYEQKNVVMLKLCCWFFQNWNWYNFEKLFRSPDTWSVYDGFHFVFEFEPRAPRNTKTFSCSKGRKLTRKSTDPNHVHSALCQTAWHTRGAVQIIFKMKSLSDFKP